jgi:hypothetical protein
MKTHNFLLLLLSLMLVLPACGGKKVTRKSQPDDIGTGVSAQSKPAPARTFADPSANQTLYLAHVRDGQDRPVSGVMVAVLVQKPEGMDIRQPRRKTVAAEMVSGRDGIAPIMIESDGKDKYVWIGGEGIRPAVLKVPPATGGARIPTRCSVTVIPVAHMIFSDASGMRVNDGIITFKKIGGSSSDVESTRPSQSDNYGTTRRCNGLGEVKYTAEPGKYGLIATKDNGTCRLYKVVNWDGDTSKPMEFKLPATSMKEQPW